MTVHQTLIAHFEGREYFGTEDIERELPQVKVSSARGAICRHPNAFTTLAPGLWSVRSKPIPKFGISKLINWVMRR